MAFSTPSSSYPNMHVSFAELAEIQNGRAAMLAVSGMVHHALINGKVQG